MTPNSDQRNIYLERHLANSLFSKLSQGKWHSVPVGEAPPFKIIGAGQSPKRPGGNALSNYAWLATVSHTVQHLMLPMHAIFIDDAIYAEVLGQFTRQTEGDWHMLLASGTQRLYHRRQDEMRRNLEVNPLMCAVGVELIRRLRETKLVIPIKHLDAVEMMESHEQQLVLAALRE